MGGWRSTYTWGLYRDYGKEAGSRYLGFRFEDGDLPVNLDVLGYKAVYAYLYIISIYTHTRL